VRTELWFFVELEGIKNGGGGKEGWGGGGGGQVFPALSAAKVNGFVD